MSHYIRTIHTPFTGPPSVSSSASASCSYASTSSSSSHSNVLVNLGGLMNKYPPGLGFGEWRAIGSSTYANAKKRPAVRLPYTNRRAPPPPAPRASRVAPASVDPFAESHHHHSTHSTNIILYNSPPALRAQPASVVIPPYNPATDVLMPPPDRNSRSKLVAGILLNRMHAPKPMRRRLGVEPRPYVRSGLSTVVCVDSDGDA